MRQKIHLKQAFALSGGLLVIIILTALITSCRKNDQGTANIPARNKMQEAADLLQGQIAWGSLENIASEQGVVYLDFNKGKKAIFIQLPDGENTTSLPSLTNAGIISSAHGLIVKDPSSEKVLLFPQNDTESLKMFEKIRRIFNDKTVNAPIAGTTLINFNS